MYNGHKVIDVHGHLSAPAEMFAFGLNLLTSPGGAGRRGIQYPAGALEASQEQHIKLLDDRNIDHQLLSPRPFVMLQWAAPDVVGTWTAATNESIHKACQISSRFTGIAQLPQHTSQDTTGCAKELERCVKEYGFVGATVNPDPGGKRETPGMDTPYWDPLYQKAQELNATLVVHGSRSSDPRTKENQFTFMVEQTLATFLLERSDVFKRFPGLRIVVVHCGGAPTRLMTKSISAQPLSGLPEGLYFDTCAYDKDFLALAFKQKGLERMCFGTECPGSGTNTINADTGKPSDDLLPVIDSIPSLSSQDKKHLYFDNPQKVFPLLKVP